MMTRYPIKLALNVPDTRYTVTKECSEHGAPLYILRFNGDYISCHALLKWAIKAAYNLWAQHTKTGDK